MKADPILEEVWRIKDKLSRELAAIRTLISQSWPCLRKPRTRFLAWPRTLFLRDTFKVLL